MFSNSVLFYTCSCMHF
uniref:Uncharacterized protein n=1 Tax=Rhizophora mucronata TaxID=61149 RepID=A0A2P2PQ00_RHIMU